MYKIPIKLDSIVLNEDEDLFLASIKLQILQILKTQDWHNLYGMLHVEAGWNVKEYWLYWSVNLIREFMGDIYRRYRKEY